MVYKIGTDKHKHAQLIAMDTGQVSAIVCSACLLPAACTLDHEVKQTVLSMQHTARVLMAATFLSKITLILRPPEPHARLSLEAGSQDIQTCGMSNYFHFFFSPVLFMIAHHWSLYY